MLLLLLSTSTTRHQRMMMVQCNKEGILIFLLLTWLLRIPLADGRLERVADTTAAAAALLITTRRNNTGGSSSSSNCHNTTTKQDNDDPIVIPFKQIGIDVHGLPVNMPLVGAGTWQYNDTIAYQSLCKAFSVGISFVDTAFGYKNQKGVGQAIRDCWQKGQGQDNKPRRRQDLFVMTKIPGGLTHQQALGAHHQNMFELNLEYVDHLMIHYPADWSATPEASNKARRQEEWLALEEIYYSGKARSIGISHYCTRHIEDVMEIATIIPSINQVEYHIGSQDVDNVIETCRQYNITFMSFSPLCGPCQYDNITQDSLINGKLVSDIGQKYNVSGAQVSLRFIIQQALEPDSIMGAVIPKSNNIEHIKSNMDLFSFELDDDDMNRLFNATKPSAEGGDCNVP